MKKILCLLLATMFTLSAWADERSAELIAGLSRKFNGYTSYRIDFSATATDQQGAMSGDITVSGNKFVLKAQGMEVFYDGSTLWNYSRQNNEVNVEALDPDNPNVMTNPSKLMAINAKDFSHRMLPAQKLGTVDCAVVELTPVGTGSGYSKIIIYLNTADMMPVKMVINSTESDDKIEIRMGKLTPNIAVSTETFRFDTKRYKGVDVIDFR